MCAYIRQIQEKPLYPQTGAFHHVSRQWPGPVQGGLAPPGPSLWTPTHPTLTQTTLQTTGVPGEHLAVKPRTPSAAWPPWGPHPRPHTREMGARVPCLPRVPCRPRWAAGTHHPRNNLSPSTTCDSHPKHSCRLANTAPFIPSY